MHGLAIERQGGAEIERSSLTAEAGRTYYYRMEVTIPWKYHAAQVTLKTVDEAEGLLLISKSAASTWKLKK